MAASPDVPLDAIPLPAAILDSSGALTVVNPAWRDAFPNAEPGIRINECLSALNPGVPELRGALRNAIHDILSGTRERFVHQAGGLVTNVSPLAGGALVIVQDCAPPAAPQPEDPDGKARAQKMETVGRLVSGVVHDFANILTLISGYSEILLNRIGAKDPIRPELDEIRKASYRGARLTSQLLGFTRGQTAQPKVIDLNGLIFDMGRMLRPIIGEYVDLQTSLGPGLGKVVADPSQMEQVIMNLILNARDAMPSGGRIRIETTNWDIDRQFAEAHSMAEGPAVMVRISDNGHGIAADALQHVFEPFFTTKEKGKGTGLGLNTVHRIVKESSGDIWVRSAPGEGATFFICLPRAQQPADTADTGGSIRQAPAGNETVLLVEDEDGVRRLLTHVLQKRGYNVIEACDGEEAIRIFERKMSDIHLVLTDMVMPGISGRALADKLWAKRPDTRVVFMSGYTDDVLVRTGALGPGMSFLQKPLRPEAVAAKVREALDSPSRPFNPR
jgi:two-component system cell cycle sensor histidine kinase/response regulator CckA